MECQSIGYRSRWALLFVVFTLLGWGDSAWAVLDLQVLEELVVYEKPSLKARQVTRLSKGDKVVVSPKVYAGFRKVLVTFGGERKGGFVSIAAINRSQIVDRGDSEIKGKRVYTKNYSLGVSLVGSYMRQGERSFTTSAMDSYNISAFTSTAFFFALFADIPWSNTMMLRPYLVFRSTKFKGEAELNGAINALRPAQVTLEQKFLGLGMLAKIYGGPRDSFWYGGGIELGNGTASDLVIDDGIPLSVEGDEKPFFLLTYGALGWDIPAPGSIWLVPDLRLGIVPNNEPMIFYFEAFFAVAYSF